MSANYGSFCTWVISLENGKEIEWIDDDAELPAFTAPSNARALVKKVHSISDLLDFIELCADADSQEEAQEYIDRCCSSFRDDIQAIASFDDIATVSLSWGNYWADNGVSPKDGCEGGSIVYHPKTSKCRISNEPAKWFVEEMRMLYGHLFGDEGHEEDE